MKKHLHKKQKNYTAIKQRQSSYALALVRTKTVQFFIGLLVLVSFVAIGFAVIKTRATLQPKPLVNTEKKVTVTPTPLPQYYTVHEGESLWNVALKAYGNPNEYTRLIDLNNIADPNNVDPGTRLRIR